LQFPAVTVTYGEQLRFEPEAEPSRERQQQVADQIFAALRALYDRPWAPAPTAGATSR
jgi:hypothetical protein